MLPGRSLSVNANRRTKKAADSAAANKHTRRTLGTLTCVPMLYKLRTDANRCLV
jgi:hypothetical protein